MNDEPERKAAERLATPGGEPVKNVRGPVVAGWSLVVVVVAVLVTVLFQLLTGQPTYTMVDEFSCRPVIGDLERMRIDAVDTKEQADKINEHVEDSLVDWKMYDRMAATLAMSQACQDARLNRQTAVNLTLAALVMVVVPVSVHGTRSLARGTGKR